MGGPNTSFVGNAEVNGRFTDDWLPERLLIIGEEISGADPRHDANRLKQFISGAELLVEPKHLPRRKIRNIARFMFLANARMPLFMEPDDRRYAVNETNNVLAHEAGGRIKAWARSGGAGMLRWYLEHVDLTGFNPAAPAPRTAAKMAVIGQSMTAVGTWAHDLMTNEARPAVAPFGALLAAAGDEIGTKPQYNAVRNALLNAGAREVGRIWVEKVKTRIWALRDGVDENDPRLAEKVGEGRDYFILNG